VCVCVWIWVHPFKSLKHFTGFHETCVKVMLLDVTRSHNFNFLNIVTVTWLTLEFVWQKYIYHVRSGAEIYIRSNSVIKLLGE
jgi:hypothetical protein